MADGKVSQTFVSVRSDVDLIPVGPNIPEDYFKRERERIFRHIWLKVGRVEELPRPGDYLCATSPFSAPHCCSYAVLTVSCALFLTSAASRFVIESP